MHLCRKLIATTRFETSYIHLYAIRLPLLKTFLCRSKHNKQDTTEIQVRPSSPVSDPANKALTATEELLAANKW